MMRQRKVLSASLGPTTLLMAMAALFIGITTMPRTTHADPITFYRSFAGNIDFQMTGASLRQESNSGDACSVATSRSADLSGIPAGANIRAAYLYWAGSGATADNQVSFQGRNVTATRTFTETFVNGWTTYHFFSGFADVTSMVPGNGTYTLSGLSVENSEPFCSVQAVVSGWSLIVIFESPAQPLRVINLYDGFRYFRASQIVLTPSNFQIPPAGCGTAGDCKWGVLTWEGDVENSAPLDGFTEDLFVNGLRMSTAANPPNNQFNSTIDLMGSAPNPPGAFTYGIDADIYSPLPLSAGDTSATTLYQSGGDLVLLSAQIFSVRNTPVADLALANSHTGDFTVGQPATFTLRVTNNGPMDASGTITVSDVLPAGLTYVSGGGSGWSCSAAGQDVTCVHPGPLANGAALPDLNLTADVDASAVPSVTNTASVSSTTFDNQTANNSDADTANVINPGPASGTKLLYFYLADAPAPDANTLRRTVNTGTTYSGNIAAGNTYTALLSPATQGPLTLSAGSIPVSLWLERPDGRRNETRDVTVTLDYFGSSNGTIGSRTLNNILRDRRTWENITFDIPLASPVTLAPNTTLRLTLSHDPSSQGNILARSLYNGVRSQIAFDTPTVINVDSVAAYTDIPFPGGTIQTGYPPNTNIRIRAVVSDPFGHDDITSAAITLLDPDNTSVVSAAPMTEVAPLSPGSPGATKTYAYAYTIPSGPIGTWTARVTAKEGTEETVSHTGTGKFLVGGPIISIVKTVSTISNPVEGSTNAKAIPGAIMAYEITVTNTGTGPADADSVIITDPLPANLRLVLNAPVAPVEFDAGTSTLTLTSTDVGNNGTPPYNDIALSNDGGSTYLSPGQIAVSGDGIDATTPRIDFIRINPKGTLPGASGGTASRFILRFKVQLQ